MLSCSSRLSPAEWKLHATEMRAVSRLCHTELLRICSVKGASRKSDGFLAFLRYASGKHTRSADNSPPARRLLPLGWGLERSPVGYSPQRSHAHRASTLVLQRLRGRSVTPRVTDLLVARSAGETTSQAPGQGRRCDDTTKTAEHKIENHRSNSTWKINFPTKKSGIRRLS